MTSYECKECGEIVYEFPGEDFEEERLNHLKHCRFKRVKQPWEN